MNSLAGRTVVITGAGSGIGLALARAVVARGAHVALTDRTADRLEPLATELRGRGARVSTHGFDVADRAAWAPFRADALAAHGVVDVLVNNAGVALTGPFLQCSLDDLEWQIGVNLWGVVYGCHTFLPDLVARPEAHLVNVSSIFGVVSVPDNAAYCMAKHAVRSLSEALENELRDTGVHVSTVHPGAIATRIVADGRYRAGGHTSEDRAGKMISKGMPPEKAAERIVAGILANEKRILVGADARFLATLHHLFPVRYRQLVGLFLRAQR